MNMATSLNWVCTAQTTRLLKALQGSNHGAEWVLCDFIHSHGTQKRRSSLICILRRGQWNFRRTLCCQISTNDMDVLFLFSGDWLSFLRQIDQHNSPMSTGSRIRLFCRLRLPVENEMGTLTVHVALSQISFMKTGRRPYPLLYHSSQVKYTSNNCLLHLLNSIWDGYRRQTLGEVSAEMTYSTQRH